MMRPGPDAGTGPDARHEYLRTSCGRELAVGRLALGDARHPAARVFVDLGKCSGCEGTGWVGLTVAEARQLARAVLAQATAAERECQAHAAGAAHGTAACAPTGTSTAGCAAAAEPPPHHTSHPRGPIPNARMAPIAGSRSRAGPEGGDQRGDDQRPGDGVVPGQ